MSESGRRRLACSRTRAAQVAVSILVAIVGAARAADPTASGSEAKAAYATKQWARCASAFQALARHVSAGRKQDAFYNAACCYAHDGQQGRAFAMLDAAIAVGFRDIDGLERDSDLANLHGTARWKATLRALHTRIADWERTLKAPELRRQLLAMVDEDQAARNAWIAARRDQPEWQALAAKLAAVDEKNTAALRAAMASWGWPGKDVVGEDGAHAAWLLAQHADRDLTLQKEALSRMKPLVDRGLVSAANYAYLLDRVAVAEHRPQRYGTQFDGSEPFPIEDASHVDARRRAVGLSTLSEYRKQLLEMYGPN